MDGETWRLYGLVAGGGALGSLLRAALSTPVPSGAFPWSVFGINVAGSLLIGVLLTLALEAARMGAEARVFLSTGVLGGFTTFSTFAGQVAGLLQTAPVVAAAYAIGSIVAGVAAALAGQAAVRALWLRRGDGRQEEEAG